MSAIPSTVPFDRDDDDESVFDVAVHEYEEALEAGALVDTDEFVARFPAVADQLLKFIAAREKLFPPSAAEELLPREFDDFREVELIAESGMGVVYKAYHISGEKYVALKTLRHRDRASASEVQRFIREFKLAAKLRHDHIVRSQFVRWHEGAPFFVMDLMEGGTLTARLGEFRLPKCGKRSGRDEKGQVWSSSKLRKRQLAIATLLETLARAIHYAHQFGILHRDVKPGNILFDGNGRPHVSDFGLAKRLKTETAAPQIATLNGSASGASIEHELTGSGGIVGTAAYMAPEQAAGKEGISTAADVYSLGVVLYELLTGLRPLVGATLTETLRMVQEVQAERPRRLNPRIDRDLEAICLKCLEKEPTKRFGSAEALADDLRRYVECWPTRARPIGVPGRVAKWVRRRPGVAALTFAVVILTVLGVGGVGWQSLQITWKQKQLEGILYLSLINNAENDIGRNQFNRADERLNACPRELRGFEWGFLKRSCQLERVFLRGHEAAVLCVQFSPDGSQVATASRDGTAKLWDPITGEERFMFTDHHGWVKSVCFSGDSQRLITVDSNEDMKVWDVATCKNLDSRAEIGDLLAASLASDLIAVRSRKRFVSVLSSRSGAKVFSAPLQESDVISVALSPDGQYLAVGGYNKSFTVYDLQTRKAQHLAVPRLEGALYNVWSVAFSADGTRLAAGTSLHSGDTQLTEWKRGQEGFEFHSSFAGSGDFVGASISYSPDGQRLAASDRDGMIRVWDTDTHKSVLAPRKHAGIVVCVAFDPSGGPRRLAVTRGAEVTIEKIDPAAFPRGQALIGHGQRDVEALAFEPDGKHLMTRAGGNEVLRWDLVSGKHCVLSQEDKNPLLRGNLSISHDGRIVVSGSEGEHLSVWGTAEAQPSAALRVDIPNTRCTAFSHDGTKLALSDATNRIILWDLKYGRKPQSWPGSTDEIHSLAFFPDDKKLAWCGADQWVHILDLGTGKEIPSLRGHERTVTCLAISPDGRRIATASADLTVCIWNPRTGERLHQLIGHDGYVNCVAFSPDGQRLVSCADDGTIRLWVVDSGQQVLTLTAQHGITAVAFSPNGNLLASCHRNGVVRIWDAQPLEDSP